MEHEISSWYKCKRWTLFTLCLIGYIYVILILVIGLAALAILPDSVEVHNHSDEKAKVGWSKGPLIAVIVIFSLICSIIPTIGIVATLKQHFGTAITFAILMTLAVFVNVYWIISNIYYMTTLIMNLIITGLAYSFTLDVNRINETKRQRRIPIPGPSIVMKQLDPTQVGYQNGGNGLVPNGYTNGQMVNGGQNGIVPQVQDFNSQPVPVYPNLHKSKDVIDYNNV